MDLAYQRKVTQAFIQQLPTEIVFIPRTKTRQPAGGFTWEEGDPRDPQVVTFIENPASPTPTITLDGIERTVDFEIVAAHDAVIGRHDVFTHQWKDWEVIDLFYDNGYEVRALVSGRG